MHAAGIFQRSSPECRQNRMARISADGAAGSSHEDKDRPDDKRYDAHDYAAGGQLLLLMILRGWEKEDGENAEKQE